MDQFFANLWAIRPSAEWATLPLFSSFVIVSLLVAIVCSLPIRSIPAWLKMQLASWGWTSAVVGGILWFFRFGQVPYLGMEGWLYLWFLAAIIWLIVLAGFTVYHQRHQVQETAATEAYKAQFLPKPKQKTPKK
jgi:hypothetical protein